MKRLFLIILSVVLLSSLILSGCGTPTPTPPTTPPTEEPPTEEITLPAIAPTAGEPVYGGTLRMITNAGPMVLGYYPEMWVTDEGMAAPAAERIIDHDEYYREIPLLAESYEVGADQKSLTFHLREGIKFSDGSELNAEVCAWNYQLAWETHKLQDGDSVTSIEVVDDYTVTLHLINYNSTYLASLGWVPMFSKAAWDAAGTTDEERAEWARTHVVGTGPYMLEEYVRDDHITWVKNPNYWQPGKPYYDKIEVLIIPDNMTAAAMMEAGEADLWWTPTPKFRADLEQDGFYSQGVFGTVRVIHMNTVDPNSPFQDQKVREAVEYALDKPGMANAIGFGYYEAATMISVPGQWGFDPNYVSRTYDPQKARDLLALAGYTEPLKVTLLAPTTQTDEATAIKACLDNAGFECELDMADPARYFTTYTGGFESMALGWVGLGPSYLVSMLGCFGPQGPTSPVSFGKPPELLDMFEESLYCYDEESKKAICEQVVRYIADNALIIPVYKIPDVLVAAPYVHTDLKTEITVEGYYWNSWSDPH